MIKKVLGFLLVSIILSGAVLAAIPDKISFQGYLEENDVAVTGTKTLRLRIYDVPTGGSPLWESGTITAALDGGFFTVMLEGISALTFDVPYYLEIYVQGVDVRDINGERQALTTAPYAMRAKYSEGVRSELNLGSGVYSEVNSGTAAWLRALGNSAYGVYAEAGGSGISYANAVYGRVNSNSSDTHAIHGYVSPLAGGSCLAGSFEGDVGISDDLTVGGDVNVSGINSTVASGFSGYFIDGDVRVQGAKVWADRLYLSNSDSNTKVVEAIAGSSLGSYALYGQASTIMGSSSYAGYFKGHVKMENDLHVLDDIFVTDQLEVNGFIDLNGTADISGNLDVHGGIDVLSSSDINVTGGGHIEVSAGNVTAVDVHATDDLIADNDIHGHDDMILDDDLTVGDKITAERLHTDGTVTGSVKNFVIDHPLDPLNKILRHSSVESPRMRNMYDGVVVLNANGEATVTLPEYFEALNNDLCYQLTTVGGHAPVYIKNEVDDNTFVIAGGEPGMKVSWQITGSRQDAYARNNPLVVEQEKSLAEDFIKGQYLYPEGFGLVSKRLTSK